MKMQQPELGKRIAEYRNDSGLTQEQLAEKTNINIRTIQRIESGEVTPRAYTLKVILDILGKDYTVVNGSTLQPGFDRSILNRAWKAGTVLIACNLFYLLLILLRDLYNAGPQINHLITIILLAMILSTIFLNLGYINIGKTINNAFLTITGIIGIVLTLFCETAYIATFYKTSPDLQLIARIMLTANAINGIFYGTGILFLKKYIEELAVPAGILVILMSVLLIVPAGLTGIISMVLSIPSMLMQVLIITRLLRQSEAAIAAVP